MVLTTAAAVEAIRDVFIFVEDDAELIIASALDRAAETTEPVIAPDTQSITSTQSAMAQERRVTDRRGSAGSGTASSIRVSTERLDQLVNLVGELVTVQARLSEVAARRDDADIREISESVDRLTAALRENSMSIRMLPLKTTFERSRRLVHDLGIELHKDVELAIEGAETELDKTVIDQLNDPLVHLIRNSMDHGIETPEARRAAGKSPTGTIHLSARHSGANVLIRISRRWARSGCGAGTRPRYRARLDGQCGKAIGSRNLLVHSGSRVFHGAGSNRGIRTGRGYGRGPAQRGGTPGHDRHSQ